MVKTLDSRYTPGCLAYSPPTSQDSTLSGLVSSVSLSAHSKIEGLLCVPQNLGDPGDTLGVPLVVLFCTSVFKHHILLDQRLFVSRNLVLLIFLSPGPNTYLTNENPP